MENSQSHGKSYDDVLDFFVKCTRIFVSVNIILFVVGNCK